jgi:protoporphyrinogen oxidase
MHDCIPQYTVGHEEKVQSIEKGLKMMMPSLTGV